jgi:CRISPR/Cas system-associated exonuclease Cas4 (RecB family)
MAKSIIGKIIKKEKQDVDVNVDLNKIVDYIYDGQHKISSKAGFTKKKTFSPSTLVFGHGHCARYWYLAFEGNDWEDKNSGQSYSNMTAGSNSHDRLQEALKSSGKLIWTEKEMISNDPPIYGFADGMVEVDGQPVLIEIKTTKDEAFEYHKRNKHASNYHLEQLLIYMKIMQQKIGAIVYENKNTNEICVVPIVVKQDHVDFIEYLFDWMRQVYAAWKNKQLPERAYRPASKVCASCPLEKVCDIKEKGDLKIERRKELGK